MKIFIDPGHGGSDPGAKGINGTLEKEVVMDISVRLGTLLSGAGHTVSYSRTSDKTLSPEARTVLANAWGADLFVSIHCNSTNKVPDTARGTETYSFPGSSVGATKAKDIHNSLVKAIGLNDRGTKTARFTVIKLTKMPAVLVEIAFINNPSDEELLQSSSFRDKVAAGLFEGITRREIGGTTFVGVTAMKLNNIWVQEIDPSNFEIVACDKAKRNVGVPNYFNLGFFAKEATNKTVPVGNLAIGGKIISQAKDNASWINVAKKKLTTIHTDDWGNAGIVKTDDLSVIPKLSMAVSGVPIIVGGKRCTTEDIKSEGYFGNETYDTWHGFLGLRHGKLVYVAMQTGFSQMVWNLVALGIYDAIKLDGGGSFILHNGKELIGTSENRRIHNVGIWG